MMKRKLWMTLVLSLLLLLTGSCVVACNPAGGSTDTEAQTTGATETPAPTEPDGTTPESDPLPAESDTLTDAEETTVGETVTEAATDYVPDFTPTALPSVNVAREGFVLTSNVKYTYEGIYSNTNLNDGDLTTGYRSDPGLAYKRPDGHFLFIDLTEERVIDSIRLYPFTGDEIGFPSDFEVLISNDGVTYTPHKTVTGAQAQAEGYIVAMDGVKAKYIKLTYGLPTGSDHIAMGELEVYSPIDTASNMQVNIDDIWLFKDPDTTLQLAVTYYRDGTAVDASKLTFVSGNPEVVTVSEAGLLTPVNFGKTKVYVMDGTNMKACDVEVLVEPGKNEFLISTFFITGYVTPEALESTIDLTVKAGVTHLEAPHIWDICNNEINMYALHLCNERGAIYTPHEQMAYNLNMTDEQYQNLLKPFEGMAGFLGIFIGDEPAETYTDYAEMYHALQSYNPHYNHHMNLFPPAGFYSGTNEYYSEFAAIAGGDYRMKYLTFDQYPFGWGNAFDPWVFSALDMVRKAGLLYNADTGFYVQSQIMTPAFDALTLGERRFNSTMAIAYGMKNFKHYLGLCPVNTNGSVTDYLSGILKPDYTPADYYNDIAEVNAFVKAIGQKLGTYDAVEVYHTKETSGALAIPEDFILSQEGGRGFIYSVFQEIDGTKQCLLVTNKSYGTSKPATVKLIIKKDIGPISVYDPLTGETTPLEYKAGEVFLMDVEAGLCKLLILEDGVDIRTQKVESDNLMLNHGMFVSSSQANFWAAGVIGSHFVTDGNRENGCWLSKADDKAPYVLLDLGEAQTDLGRLVLIMNSHLNASNYMKNFTISYSADGKTYTELTTVTDATYDNADKSYTVDLGGVEARYIRINIDSKTPVGVGEVEVYKK